MTSPVSKPKSLAVALLSASLTTAVHAENPTAPPPSPADLLNQLAQLVLYAVTPYCQVLSNGLRACQPIGLVGPAPGPTPTYQPLVPVPLAPPTLQPSWLPPMPYTGNPYLPAMGAVVAPWSPAGGLGGGTTSPLPPAPQLPSAQTPTFVSQRPEVAPASTMATAPEPASTTSSPPVPQIAAIPTPAPASTVPVTALPDPVSGATAAVGATVARVEAAGTPSAQTTAGQTVIVHFGFDSAQLTAAGRAVLDAWLASGIKPAQIVITGHADRLGPATYNHALSRRRAEAARAYLLSKGVDASRIQIVARGEGQPVKHCKGGANPRTIACLAPNRRVEIDPK